MFPPDGVVGRKKDEHGRPDDAAPVHGVARGVGRRGEELEDPEDGQKRQSDDVNGVAGFAEVEARGGHGFAAEAFAEDA